MPIEDVAMRRQLMHEVAKRPIDYSLLDLHVVHGVVYLRGTVRKLRGYDADPEEEIEILCRIFRQKPGIREVVNEVTVRH
ncbi:MAG: hypothetical protein ACUVTY_04220 [Armatimonadota bacterium]